MAFGDKIDTESSAVQRKLNTANILSLLVLIALIIIGCFQYEAYQDRNMVQAVLFVEISKDDEDDFDIETNLSDSRGLQLQIEKALEIGGDITLSAEIASFINYDFESIFTISNKDEKYLIRPAILNFVGNYGWEFKQKVAGEYIFTKRVKRN